MEIIFLILLIPFSIVLAEFIASYSIYICQEINHSVRKMIKGIKSIRRVV